MLEHPEHFASSFSPSSGYATEIYSQDNVCSYRTLLRINLYHRFHAPSLIRNCKYTRILEFVRYLMSERDKIKAMPLTANEIVCSQGLEAWHGMAEKQMPYSRKIWQGIKFGRIKFTFTTARLKCTNISYLHIYIYMAIPYRTTKLKFTNIFQQQFGAQLPNLIPANISGYMISILAVHFRSGSAPGCPLVTLSTMDHSV